MKWLAIQYLEDGPEAARIAPERAAARLRAAFARLPLTHVLLGWNLPPAVVDACRAETARAGARLYRWHPLLTGDGVLVPRPEWQTIGLSGERVPGFGGMPEFTFVCPNRPAVREAVAARLDALCDAGCYDGMFLDRIRFPSPLAAPARALACFCPDCQRAAAEDGIDLQDVRRRTRGLLGDRSRVEDVVRALLDPESTPGPTAPSGDPDLATLNRYARFRARSVTRAVRGAAAQLHARGLEVGLDCFSPALAWAVGQDLGALDACGAWIKTMSYGHTDGPAGLPFELLALADWLVAAGGDASHVLDVLSRAARLPLPSSRAVLRARGLAADALAGEARRARGAGVRVLLAGIELVAIEGVTRLEDAQIEGDLRALVRAGVDGLALSWDLLYMPLEWLDLVRRVAFEEQCA
ncbi:MAG: hypothetical protein JXA09_09850 [Anaerolineae bacterium]|nr:hypothetical protein [Anaerolineae bacterium]